MTELRKLQLAQLKLLQEVDRICRLHKIQYNLVSGTLLGAVRHKGFIPWDDDIDISMPFEDYNKFCMVCEKELDTSRFFLQNMETDSEHRYIFAKFRHQGTLCVRKGQEHMSFHQGIYIDIFPKYPVPENRFIYRIFSFVVARCKTILWSPIGAVSEKCFFYRMIYKALALIPKSVPQKLIFFLISKCSGKFKVSLGKPSFRNRKLIRKKLSYIRANKITEYTPRQVRENQRIHGSVELEFEGLKCFAPENYDFKLTRLYGDYMKLPPVHERIGHHQATIIDFGDLCINEVG